MVTYVLQPAIEYNRGILPQAQFHIVVPMAWNVPAHGNVTTDLGDIELGVKYRFEDVMDDTLQLGIFPMLELTTGNARRGFGSGRTWYRLPLWVQKSDGPWTFDDGGGMIVNSGTGMKTRLSALCLRNIRSARAGAGAELFR